MKYMLILGVALAAVTSPAFAKPATAQIDAAATDAPVVIPPPPPGMSQVVFFRPGAMGMAISCNIRENGKMLGTTNNGRYWVLTTAPGPHVFTTKSEATDTLNIEAEPDETQYVKCKIGMGIMAGRPNLSPSTKEEFDSKSARMRLADPEKAARAIAEDDAKRAAAGAAN
ncbi:MAG: hypothetical protein QM605_01680 [Sphingobium sp.]